MDGSYYGTVKQFLSQHNSAKQVSNLLSTLLLLLLVLLVLLLPVCLLLHQMDLFIISLN